MRFGGRGLLGTASFHHWKTERSACLGIPPPALPHSWLAENKVGDIQMAVGAFEPGAGGEGKGCRQGMLFQTKKEMLAPKERKGSSFLLLVVAFL